MSDRRLLVGIGSPHGDDQVGWIIARHAALAAPRGLDVQCLAAPIDLLQVLGSAGPIARLDVCDAVAGAGLPGELHQWSWPDPQLAHVPFSGSHDLPLVAALELASTLGRLPPEVRIWGVTIAAHQPFGEISPRVTAAAARVVANCLGVAAHA